MGAAAPQQNELDVHGSVHHNINLIEITKKMQPCSRIYYSNVSQLLNTFRATQRSSSGAQKL
jgi:MOSC domain-containing protein YiiM